MIYGSFLLLFLTFTAIFWQYFSISFKYLNPKVNPPSYFNSELISEQKFLLNGPIDINEASFEDLEAIPRVGPKMANRSLDFRQKHGKVQFLNELLEVKGIKEKTLAMMRPYLRIVE